MTVKRIRQRNSYFVGYQHTETIATGENGDDIFIPALPAGKTITCRMFAGVGTAKFQTSTSDDDVVLAGNGVFEDWDIGDKTGTYSHVIDTAVSGVRAVSVSGEIDIEVII